MKIIQKKGVNFIIMDLLLLVYFVTLIYPPISARYNAVLLRLVCMVGWLIMSFLNKRNFYFKTSIHTTYVLFFYIATVGFPYILGIPVIGNRYLALGMIPMGYFIFCYYKACGKLRHLEKLLLIIIIFILPTYFDTLNALIENPYASRSIKSFGEESRIMAEQGIGGYSFIYFMSIISVLLLYILLKTTNKIVKLLALIGFVMAFFIIIKSNYMTALLFTFTSSMVLVIVNYAKKGVMNTLILILIASLFLLFNIKEILNSFSHVLPERIARVILVEEGESLIQAIMNEFTTDRLPTLKMSIDAFCENPILGMVGAGTVQYDGIRVGGFGEHSHILDTFALFGAVIGLVNIYVILRPFKDMQGKWIHYGKEINAAMMICTLGIYLFNNATEAIALAGGIIFPVLREHYSHRGVLHEKEL